MAIICFDKDSVVDYVPAYGGNRESDEPCVVSLKFIPYSKVQHYSRVIASRLKEQNDAEKISEANHYVQKKQFVESVEKITNFFINDKEVDSVEVFYESADSELIIEILEAMESQQKLSKGQIKN